MLNTAAATAPEHSASRLRHSAKNAQDQGECGGFGPVESIAGDRCGSFVDVRRPELDGAAATLNAAPQRQNPRPIFSRVVESAPRLAPSGQVRGSRRSIRESNAVQKKAVANEPSRKYFMACFV